jgi:hypothetical protein
VIDCDDRLVGDRSRNISWVPTLDSTFLCDVWIKKMVVHIAAATRAASAASQAGATALGLGLGKTDLDLAQSFFRSQMQQTKRLWTVDFAEASIRHGESCAQSARQHVESQAAANAAYFQAERLASQSIRLARDQDSRAYEMAWRAEVRESLRDELGNQNNRFNIIMLWWVLILHYV